MEFVIKAVMFLSLLIRLKSFFTIFDSYFSETNYYNQTLYRIAMSWQVFTANILVTDRKSFYFLVL